MFQPDEIYMSEALRLAQEAFENNEIPVGALVVANGRIIGKGYNQVERLNDPTAHAEMLAITGANNYLGARHLKDCTLYVTLEPCPMCAGAISWAQIGRIVFGAFDEKRGFQRFAPSLLPNRTEVVGGILANECEALLKDFFKQIRTK